MSRWTRPELLLTLNLYFETSFGKQHKTYPPIVELADVIGRTPSAVAMKMSNFTSLDPAERERGISGLSGASNLDREIWLEFKADRERIVDEIESLLEQKMNRADTAAEPMRKGEYSSDASERETSKLALVKQRRHQNFFRRVVLGSYELKCCVTSNPVPELLRASHIVPWSQSPKQRLNPKNGLCLSATLDAAFDKGLITFSEDYSLVLSPRLGQFKESPEIQQIFIKRDGMRMALPDINLPDPKFLKWHRDVVFNR